MATEPFRYQGKTIDEMSPEELAEARDFLTNAARGHAGLVGGQPFGQQVIPEDPGANQWRGISGGAALMPGAAPPRVEERDPLREALDRIQGTSFDIGELRRRQYGEQAAAPATPGPAAGASPSVPLPSPYVPQGPEEAGSQIEYKTVIASRRTPDGRIVFETQRVPVSTVAAQGLAEEEEGNVYGGPGLGVEEWRARALAENPQRAAATARFAGANPSGARSTGFQVGAGEGGFSPSRQIPLEKSWEEVFATESPLVQEKWLEAKRQGMELESARAPIEEAALRRRILTQQAARLEDPSIVLKERMLLGQQLLPQAQERRTREVDARVEQMAQLLRSAGKPPDETVMAALRMEAEKKVPPVDTFAQQLVDYYLSTEPEVNAARQRSSTYNIGG